MHLTSRCLGAGRLQLLDRFTLPVYSKGVRSLTLSDDEHCLIAGCTNGWVLHFDLRSGRYERKLSHADCVNALDSYGPYLASAGDDKYVRVTDLRQGSFAPLAAHRMRSVVFAACMDRQAVYVGQGDNGDVRKLDYSSAANPTMGEGSGGFNTQQKAALAAALEAVERRPQRGSGP